MGFAVWREGMWPIHKINLENIKNRKKKCAVEKGLCPPEELGSGHLLSGVTMHQAEGRVSTEALGRSVPGTDGLYGRVPRVWPRWCGRQLINPARPACQREDPELSAAFPPLQERKDIPQKVAAQQGCYQGEPHTISHKPPALCIPTCPGCTFSILAGTGHRREVCGEH